MMKLYKARGDAKMIKVEGKGEAGKKGGKPGDLYVRIFVKPHSILKRKGDDLYTSLLISISQAVLGDEIEELQIKRNSIQTSLTETLRLQDKKQDLLSQSEIDLERIEGVWQANKIRMADWKCAKEGIAQMSTLPGFAPKVAP